MSDDMMPASAGQGIRGTDGPGAPTVLRILLGTQLRRLRESRGISAQEAARAIRGSESKISRIEVSGAWVVAARKAPMPTTA